ERVQFLGGPGQGRPDSPAADHGERSVVPEGGNAGVPGAEDTSVAAGMDEVSWGQDPAAEDMS
ncbi:MAG: hypothetical protein ACM3L6_04995, partial [Deltaproteobacteria bacterium]